MESKKIAEELIDDMDALKGQLETWIEKSRKVSAKKARKMTSLMSAKMKEFRRLSVADCKLK